MDASVTTFLHLSLKIKYSKHHKSVEAKIYSSLNKINSTSSKATVCINFFSQNICWKWLFIIPTTPSMTLYTCWWTSKINSHPDPIGKNQLWGSCSGKKMRFCSYIFRLDLLYTYGRLKEGEKKINCCNLRVLTYTD